MGWNSTTNVGWVWPTHTEPDPRMALKLQIDGSILGSESLGLIGGLKDLVRWGKPHIGMTYRDLPGVDPPPKKKKTWRTCMSHMFFLFSWNMLWKQHVFLETCCFTFHTPPPEKKKENIRWRWSIMTFMTSEKKPTGLGLVVFTKVMGLYIGYHLRIP